MRVLVVEADAAAALEIEAMLRSGGHQPVQGNSQAPDVAIVDYRLGIHTARRLRERCRARIIFTSAASDARTLATIEAFRPAALLARPFTAEQLLLAVQRAVS